MTGDSHFLNNESPNNLQFTIRSPEDKQRSKRFLPCVFQTLSWYVGLANSKVEKYQACLDAEKKSYEYMVNNLRQRTKQKEIEKMQSHLQGKLKRAKKETQKYQALLEREFLIRSSIQNLEQSIFESIETQTNHRTPNLMPMVLEKNGFHAKLPDVELVMREFQN
ncbi:unnamed protein product [Mytilus coruscus]|uniref:Uncharacterized protein n=1 Tax=Mytilus coruscus TaxID=42192 RepID=A0A6J8CWV4_MYTCO|nr:unnamed protein product [Mytilus coruscus]